MDESGNTQQVIAVGLVSIPQKEIPEINRVFSITSADPKEIQVLYEKKSRGEFKYSDLRNAFRQTQLEVYDEFLRRKLKEISSLRVSAYSSVFPNPMENDERLARLTREAEDLLHKWAHQNKEAALSRELEILVDQQVLPEPYLFQYYLRRGQYHCSLLRKRIVDEGETRAIHGDRENSVHIKDVNSKSFKSVQLADFIVGCAREHFALGTEGYYEIIRNLLPKEHLRIQTRGYSPSARGFISGRELAKW